MQGQSEGYKKLSEKIFRAFTGQDRFICGNEKIEKEEIFSETESESSEIIRKRVIKAREIQRKRFNEDFLNGKMNRKQISEYCKIDEEAKKILERALMS